MNYLTQTELLQFLAQSMYLVGYESDSNEREKEETEKGERPLIIDHSNI